jgi:hypothetical protein
VLLIITGLQNFSSWILKIQEFKQLGEIAECFRKAAELFSPQVKVEPIEIPYEQTTLPGYLYKVDDYYSDGNDSKHSKPKRPTLIAHGGFDSTLEELYASAAADQYKKKDCAGLLGQ